MKITPLFAIALCLFNAHLQAADEWPQFRGPDGQGHTDATELPLTWSETENIVWRTPIPGEGHSSPVISNQSIWLTTAIVRALTEEEEAERLSSIKNSRGLDVAAGLRLLAILIDRESGEIKKQVPLFEVEKPEPKHLLNSYASPTPVISEGRVYVHFGTYGTACLNADTGEVIWKNDTIHIDHQNGPGSSPIVHGPFLIVHFDGTDRQFITAFNKATGEVAWQQNRSGEMDPKPELKKAYGTPLVVNVDGRAIVVSPAANWVYGYDAETGDEIWKANYGKLGFSTVPRPVFDGQQVYISTSFMQPRLVAVKCNGVGDVTDTHVSWISDQQAPKKPSMLFAEGKLYSVTDNGIAACLNAKDGSDIWKARLTGDFSASPLYAAGRIYFFGQNGQTTVMQAGDEAKELTRNTLPEGFMASPAVAGSSLFLRTEKALYRIQQQ